MVSTFATLDTGIILVITRLIGSAGYIYVFLRSEKSSESFGFVTELPPTGASAEDPVNNDGADSDEAVTESSEYPPWSSEDMIHWMYARCERRMNKAVLSRNPDQTNRYLMRQLLLSDMLALLETADDVRRNSMQQMPNDISDLSTEEESPT